MPSLTRRQRIVGLTVVAACLVGLGATAPGCGDSNGEKTETTPAARQPVPSSLGDVESGAEDTIDFARQEARAKVVTAARELQAAADGPAAAALRKAQVPEDQIALLKQRAGLVSAVAARSGFLRISLAANQVSALMPELYARYSDPVPPQVLALDYLDREAQLRSLARDRRSTRAAVNGLSATWKTLEPKVEAAGGAKTAAEFARHVAAMRRLVTGANQQALQREAVVGLELVDELESVFRKQ